MIIDQPVGTYNQDNIYFKGDVQSYSLSVEEATYYHTFFSKTLKKALIIPSYVQIDSFPDDEDQYSGYATDDDSFAKYESYYTKYAHLESDAQATSMAEAIISQLKVDAQRGAAIAPLNVGAEIYDYINVIDSVESDSRTGNHGYIKRVVGEGLQPTMEFGFGKVPIGGVAGTRPSKIKSTSIESSTSNVVSHDQMRSFMQIVDEVINEIGATLSKIQDEIEYLKRKNLTDVDEVSETDVSEPNRGLYIHVIAHTSDLEAGDSQVEVPIPELLCLQPLISAHAFVSNPSAVGKPEIRLYNVTQGYSILSTNITIDANEYNSYTAANQPVIDYDSFTAGDRLRVDVIAAGSGTKGLGVWLEFGIERESSLPPAS